MRSLPENTNGPYAVPLIPESVTTIVQLFTPARSSAIPNVIGVVVSAIVAHAFGMVELLISHGLTGALKLVEIVPVFHCQSATFHVIVMSCSIP